MQDKRSTQLQEQPQATDEWLDAQLRQLRFQKRVMLSPPYLVEQRPSLERIAARTELTRPQIVHRHRRPPRQLRSRAAALHPNLPVCR